jgi:hypothetical protein
MPRVSIHRRTLVPITVTILAVLAAACADSRSPLGLGSDQAPASLAKRETSPTKITFTGVTLSDAGGTFTNATIFASSKQAGNGTGTTVCDFSASDGSSLGQFEAATFITPPADLEQFCIDNFANRQIG